MTEHVIVTHCLQETLHVQIIIYISRILDDIINYL